jgi:DNA-binding IclR family transcriptional regulator
MSAPSDVNRETPGAQTLRRGLSILRLLARYQVSGGLGVSEIARKLELNKATTVPTMRCSA